MNTDKLPEQPSNVTPIKKKRGNPNLGTTRRNKGPITNNPARVTFKRNEYHLPGDIELGLAQVVITRDEIKLLAADGNTWQTIEDLFQVSQTDIKKHYEGIYNQGKAILEVNMMRTLTKKALDGDTPMGIWMSKNRLGMSDKTTVLDDTKPINENEVKNKLEALLKKHMPKGMK